MYLRAFFMILFLYQYSFITVKVTCRTTPKGTTLNLRKMIVRTMTPTANQVTWTLASRMWHILFSICRVNVTFSWTDLVLIAQRFAYNIPCDGTRKVFRLALVVSSNRARALKIGFVERYVKWIEQKQKIRTITSRVDCLILQLSREKFKKDIKGCR